MAIVAALRPRRALHKLSTSDVRLTSNSIMNVRASHSSAICAAEIRPLTVGKSRANTTSLCEIAVRAAAGEGPQCKTITVDASFAAPGTKSNRAFRCGVCQVSGTSERKVADTD
jgi:hypothetical protein